MGTSVGPTNAHEADMALEMGPEVESAPEPMETVETTETPDLLSSDRPRDAQGRFAKDAPTPEPEPTDEVAAVPDSEMPSEPAAAEAEVPVSETPFKYTGDGREIDIPGSDVGDDGVFIPKAYLPELTKKLAAGEAMSGSAQRWFQEANTRQQQTEQRAIAAESKVTASEAQTAHVLGHFEGLIGQSEQLIRAGASPMDTPIGQWLLDCVSNWRVLQAESKVKAIESRTAADRQLLEQNQTKEREAQLQPMKESTLQQWVTYYGQQSGLDAASLESILGDLKQPRYESSLFVRAPHDDLQSGIRKGDLAIDHSVVKQEIERVARWLAPYRGQAKPTPAKAVAPAIKPKVPPTVGATRGPAPKKSSIQPKTREEADDLLMSGNYELD